MGWRKTLQKNSVAVSVVAAVVIVAAFHSCRKRLSPPVYRPKDTYHCEAGHEWTAGVSAAPVCPVCGKPGISESRYRCHACKAEFVGLEVEKLDVGQYRYRLPGQTNWVAAPPESLTCPKCGVRAPIIGGFTGLGYGEEAPPDDGPPS